MRTVPKEKHRSRRRGAALVLVLIFSVAALTLVTTMLTLTDGTTKMQGEVERHKNLQAVLKTGISAAINEINRNERTGSYDPGNDGVGAITGWGGTASTNPPGVEVVVSVNGQSRSLGFYRTAVEDRGGKKILTVVAAWPNFAAVAASRAGNTTIQAMTAAAEVEIDPTVVTDTVTTTTGNAPVNPVNFSGNPGGEFQIQMVNNFGIDVSGLDLAGSANVPAANVEQGGSILDTFKTDLAQAAIDNGDTFVGSNGQDVNDPDPTSDLSETVTNNPAAAMSVANLKDAETRYTNLVTTKLAGPKTTISSEVKTALDLTGDPDAVFYASDLQISQNGGSITGEGTLIIEKSLHVVGHNKNPPGTLDWKGDVIIIGDDGGSAQYHLNNPGARVDIEGNLIILANDTQFHINNNSKTAVEGGLLMLGSQEGSQAQFHLNNTDGATVEVKGVLGIMAEQQQFHLNNNGADSDLIVNSLNFAFPNSDPSKNKLQFKLNNNARMSLQHHSGYTSAALAGLGISGSTSGGTSTTTITYKKVRAKTYWEPAKVALTGSSPTVFAYPQDNLFAGDSDGPWGF